MRIGKRRISKKLVLIVVPVVLVLGGTTGALAATGTFTDIAGNAHEQSIIKMADRGITTGYPDGTFRPDQPVTRGQMMTFLDRATRIPAPSVTTTRQLITARRPRSETLLHGEGEAFSEEAGSRAAPAVTPVAASAPWSDPRDSPNTVSRLAMQTRPDQTAVPATTSTPPTPVPTGPWRRPPR